MEAFVLASFTTMPIALINGFSPLLGRIVVFIAQPFAVIVCCLIVGFLALRRLPQAGVFSPFENLWQRVRDISVVAFCGVITWVTAVLLKMHFQVLRPSASMAQLNALFSQSDYGFPSGHAAVFTALAVILFFISRRAGMLASVAALLIASARVFSGVHTPLDILGGFLLGFAISLIVGFGIQHISRT